MTAQVKEYTPAPKGDFLIRGNAKNQQEWNLNSFGEQRSATLNRLNISLKIGFGQSKKQKQHPKIFRRSWNKSGGSAKNGNQMQRTVWRSAKIDRRYSKIGWRSTKIGWRCAKINRWSAKISWRCAKISCKCWKIDWRIEKISRWCAKIDWQSAKIGWRSAKINWQTTKTGCRLKKIVCWTLKKIIVFTI